MLLRKISFLLAYSLLILSCKQNSDYENLKSEINISTDDFMVSYGIYALNDEEKLTITTIDSLVKTKLKGYTKYLNRNKRRSEKGYFVEKIQNPTGILAAPSEDYLKTYGKEISDDQISSLQKTQEITVLTFYGNHKNTDTVHHKINEFLNLLLEEKQHVIVDFGTIEYFNKSTWQKRRVKALKNIPIDITSQILIKLDNYKQDSCRVFTFGMEKFCLPDISISGLPCERVKNYTDLLVAISQNLHEKRLINQDSTFELKTNTLKNKKWNTYFSGKRYTPLQNAEIKFQRTTPKLGDKNNIQLKVDFNHKDIAAIMLKLTLNSVGLVSSSENNQMLEISKQAKKKLPEIKVRFQESKLPENFLLIKAPFFTGKIKEWIWVEVTEWKENIIKGKLYSDSEYSSYLTAGVFVSVQQNDVFDYIIKDTLGNYIGNETEKVLILKK